MDFVAFCTDASVICWYNTGTLFVWLPVITFQMQFLSVCHDNTQWECTMQWKFYFLIVHVLLGHRVGRLRTNGPQILHGSSTNLIGGAGPGQQRDWLVQTVSALLFSRPHAGVTDQASFPVVSGQFFRTRWGSILVH